MRPIEFEAPSVGRELRERAETPGSIKRPGNLVFRPPYQFGEVQRSREQTPKRERRGPESSRGESGAISAERRRTGNDIPQAQIHRCHQRALRPVHPARRTPASGRLPTCYGPDFIAKAVQDWIGAVGIRTAHIAPGTRSRGLTMSIFSTNLLVRKIDMRSGHGSRRDQDTARTLGC